MRELASVIRATRGVAIYAPEFLVEYGDIIGGVKVLPDRFLEDPERLALAAVVHVGAGRVKLAKPAAERAVSYPLAASLDFKASNPIDGMQPLRTALLLGIATALIPL
jgi:hypothetical protein